MKLLGTDARYLLVAALCAVGALLSAHQYYVLVLVDDSLKSHAAVAASLGAAIGAEAIVRDPSAVRSATKLHIDASLVMTQAAQKLVASGRASQVAEGTVWIGVFVLVMLSIRRRS